MSSGCARKPAAVRDAALAAWERIPPRSPFAFKATICAPASWPTRADLAAAEELLSSLPRPPGPDGSLVRQGLELLLRMEGRNSELLPLIVETWEGTADPGVVLRRIYLLDNSAFPIDYVRTPLIPAIVTTTGSGWARPIWQCGADSSRRPRAGWIAARSSGPAIGPSGGLASSWRLRPSTLMALNGQQGTCRASGFTTVELLRLRAWVTARQGDSLREREALQALVDQDPGNIGAWDRLSEFAVKAGRMAEAAEYRKRKAERNTDRLRYKNLIERDDRAAHATELGQLAERLGRRLEARGWSLIRRGKAATERLTYGTGTRPICHRPRPGGGTWRPTFQNGSRSNCEGFFLARCHPHFCRRRRGRRLAVCPEQWPFRREEPPSARDHVRRRRPARFRRRRLARRLCGAGGAVPAPGKALGTTATGCSGTGVTARFEDVTARAGIAAVGRGYGHGVAVADYDNDGRPDLFLTRWRSYALYHNKGDGTFEDVTARAGLGGDRDWPTSAAFADLDGDGDLDLYVCHYLRYDPSNPKRCSHPDSPDRHECNPLDFPALADHVFRNDEGRFVEVTEQAGFVDHDGRGLGVVAADLDDDGRIDLYVANDMSANYLFHNLGGFHFEETGQLSGAAASADGGYKAGMGIACGDLDGDGQPDLAVTNYFGESTTFYQNLGKGFFADHSLAIGLAAPTRRLLGFGIAFFDVNNDGWLDLLSANGHVLDARPTYPWTMPLQLLLASPGGHLTDVSEESGPPFRPLHLGRGLAIGDLDNDGRLDALVVVQNEQLVLLHNQTEPRGHFIRFRLEGTRSNRDAVGARVTISCAGRNRVGFRVGGSSFQSSSDPRVHFGIGNSTRIDSVEVKWPSGRVDRHPRARRRPRVFRTGRRGPGGNPVKRGTLMAAGCSFPSFYNLR